MSEGVYGYLMVSEGVYGCLMVSQVPRVSDGVSGAYGV